MAELLGGQLGWAATQAPPRLSGGQARDRPLTNQVPFHLGPKTVSRNQTSAFGGRHGFCDNGRMIIGYARVSTADQRLDLQVDALTKASCDRIFTDDASGGRGDRVGVTDARSHLRAGDTLMVWKLDRLGRSVLQLVESTAQLEKRGRSIRKPDRWHRHRLVGGRR